MYVGLCVKCRLFFSREIFGKYSNIKFHSNPSSGRLVVAMRTDTDRDTDRHGQTDTDRQTRTDMPKLTVAVRNFANMPKKFSSCLRENTMWLLYKDYLFKTWRYLAIWFLIIGRIILNTYEGESNENLKYFLSRNLLNILWSCRTSRAIWCADPWHISRCAAISFIVTRRFSFTMASTAAMASGVTTRCAWPGRGQSVTELMPFMNFPIHPYTCCSDRHASPYWTFICRWISMGFTPSLLKKWMTERCSSLVHVASGPPSLHYYCAVVLHSCIVLPPVSHSSNHQYHCCQLTDNRAVFGICIALLRFFLVSLCLKANAEIVPNIPSCHYMLLM